MAWLELHIDNFCSIKACQCFVDAIMPRPPILRGALSSPRPFVCRQCLQSARHVAIRQTSTKTTATSATERITQANGVGAGQQNSILEILEERGYIKDIAGSRSALIKLLQNKRVGAYAGIDPTAPSLHLGHLLPFMILFWLYIHGYHAVSLIGGATAKVGDPSGRLSSRKDMDQNTRVSNASAMHDQVTNLWMNVRKAAEIHGYKKGEQWKNHILDNSAWLNKLTVIDFLAVLGRGARMGTMMGRDTVKNKMTKGDGMSYAEFTYPLLQAWDWWHMYDTKGVQIQIGGSDQYGNIVAGMDAIKYIASSKSTKEETEIDAMEAPYGITTPLLTTSSGEKFGKSAGNAVWLNPDMTSPFDLYGVGIDNYTLQDYSADKPSKFLLRSTDTDIKKYLCLFTFLPLPKIDEVMQQHMADPGKRLAQHLLAREVLNLVHGPEVARATEKQHRLFRKPTLASLTTKSDSTSTTVADATESAAQTEKYILPKSLVVNTPIPRILYHAGLAPTKSAANRLIQSNGAYIGAPSGPDSVLDFTSLKEMDVAAVTSLVEQTGILVLRVGKWKVKVIEVVDDVDFEAKGLDAPGWAEFKAPIKNDPLPSTK